MRLPSLVSRCALLAGLLCLPRAIGAAEPPDPATRRGAEILSLRQALTTALEHDDIGGAAKAIRALLSRGVEPSNVALTTQARLSPRAAAVLPGALADAPEPGMTEVILLLAASRGDWGAVDSLTTALGGRSVSAPALQMVAAQALDAGQPVAVAWAHQRLRSHGRSWAAHSIVPLAEALIELGRTVEAAALLDSSLHENGPGPLRHQALVLRARLLFTAEGKDEEALALLDKVPRGRPERADAELLATLIRFAASGSDSLAKPLEAAARLRPDLPEANDAYDLAQLSSLLPTDLRVRARTMESIRDELRGRWEPAAEGYRAVRAALSAALSTRLGIREARCWERLGRLDRALDTWQGLDTGEDDGPLVLLGAGDCLMAMAMPDSARACYLAVLERFPESPHAGRARSRLLQ